MRKNISQERLRDMLDYNPSTGVFVWKRQCGPSKKGDIAGNESAGRKAYWQIGIYGGRYFAHRLAWLYMTGEMPKGMIDHKDNDGLNNQWDNLREASRTENLANRPAQRNNTSGQKGVRQINNRFYARIKVLDREIALGAFATAEEANCAYALAAKQHFGEFARAS